MLVPSFFCVEFDGDPPVVEVAEVNEEEEEDSLADLEQAADRSPVLDLPSS